MKNQNFVILMVAFCSFACSQISNFPIEKNQVKASDLENQSDETNQETPKSKFLKNCICPQMWLPVCGDNGKTYSNSCHAKCAGVQFKMGSCEKKL